MHYLPGKRHFVDVVILSIFTWEDYPGYPGGSNIISIGGRNVKDREWKCDDGSRSWSDDTTGFEDREGATSQGMRAASRCWKGKDTDSLLELSEEM